MRYKLLASFFLMMLCKWSTAQNIALRINILNEKNETVVNATAQILRATDSTLLFVKTLKTNDVFFSIKKNTAYLIRITSVNTNLIFQPFFSGERDTILNIKAQTKSKKLDEVVVTSRTPLVKQEGDKTIVDAEPLANSSTNALEILEKTPGAIVDQDGNVYLNSATPAVIYLNGRELRMSAQDVASLLKGLPANSISKIEILRNPSAKYDAASSGGIVNIVLKKGVKLGTNGSVDASYFQGVYATETIGFNVSKNDKKLNTYLSYNFTNRKTFQNLTSVRPTNQIIFIQSFYATLPAVTNYAGGGFDYRATNKLNIAYDVRFTANNNRSNVTNDIDILSLTRQPRAKNISVVSNTGPTYFVGNTVSTKYKIDSIGSEWTNSLEYTFFKSDNKQLYDNITIFPAKNTFFGDGVILNKKNIIVLKSDLVFKTKSKVIFETGFKINIARSNNNAVYFADTSTGRYINTYQTNSFKYKENIVSVYFQATKTFKGLTVKPGIRLEHTDITGNQIIPTANTFTIKRTDLFPYVFLRHSLGKAVGFKLTGNLIFRRSITRPFYEALNPFPRFVDQYTYDVGNPNLRPQITNNYEFNINANEFPVFSIGLNDIKNIFTTLTNAKADTLFRTYDNLGKNKEVYMRLVVGIPPGKKYFFYAGTQMNIINYDGIYNGENFTFHRTTFNIFMVHNYKATPTLNFTLNGFMRLNGVFNFFDWEPLGSLNVSANKSILKKKMSIILSGNDLLRTNIQKFSIDVPKFIGNGRGFQDTRRVGIALKYNFGLKPRPEKKQGFDIPPEAN